MQHKLLKVEKRKRVLEAYFALLVAQRPGARGLSAFRAAWLTLTNGLCQD